MSKKDVYANCGNQGRTRFAVSELVERARQFAAEAHAAIHHVRRYSKEPYIVHPRAVAALVAQVTDDAEVLAAAWLHDVVEDTPVELPQIEAEFGPRVARLVSDLTDVSRRTDGNREVRKGIDLLHTQQACPAAKTVKLADLIDNARSITKHDPKLARVFMREMRLLLEVLREGDSALYHLAENLVDRFFSD